MKRSNGYILDETGTGTREQDTRENSNHFSQFAAMSNRCSRLVNEFTNSQTAQTMVDAIAS